MKLNKTLLALVALAATAAFASAQDNNRGGNREEFRARMAEQMKTSLKVSNDEWAVLQPLIEKVQTKQREGFGGFGGFGGRGGRGGGNGGGDGNNDRPGAAERSALRTALEADSTSAEDIKTKLEAVRAFRKKTAAELAAAREDLKKVVTVRQEAVLVSMGVLE
jgi:hypothetical protein